MWLLRKLHWRGIRDGWFSLFLFFEGVGLVVQRFWSDVAADDQDTVVEGRGLARVEGEVQKRSLGFEAVRAERVNGEETVVSSVPVGRVVGVTGVVKDRDGFSLAVGCGAGKLAPLS